MQAELQKLAIWAGFLRRDKLQEPPQPRVVIPEARGCNFHPAVPSIAQRRAQQATLQNHTTQKKKTPKEAAGCGRPPCSELNWQFRGHGPRCVGLDRSGDVSITYPPVWLTVIFCGVCNTISSPSNQCRNGHLSPGDSSRYTKSEVWNQNPFWLWWAKGISLYFWFLNQMLLSCSETSETAEWIFFKLLTWTKIHLWAVNKLKKLDCDGDYFFLPLPSSFFFWFWKLKGS